MTYNRRSLVELEEQRKYVRDLLERDLIEPGDGEFVAPMLMVRKKDGTKRVVIDYRHLNANTVPDYYPIPRIDNLLDYLSGQMIFSTLDATDGFWQILMESYSKKYTGFMVGAQHFQWKVMPMGLTNSPTMFKGL